MIKCSLTELGRAGWENIWPSVMTHGPRCARSVRRDLGPNIFPSGPPTQLISIYFCIENMSNWVVVCFVGGRCCNLIEHSLTFIMSSLYQEK